MFFQSKRYNILDQRYNIAFFAAFFSFPSFLFFANEFYDIFIYYVLLAVVFDQLARIFKPASMDAQKTHEQHKMTMEQIDAYVKSKRTYRLIAASIASVVGLIAKICGSEFGYYFVVSCAVMWCLYPLIRISYLKIPAPKLFVILKNGNSKGWHFKKIESITDRYYDSLTPGTLGYDVNKMHNMMNSINSHSKTLL